VSPRSKEFIAEARDRAAAASSALHEGFPHAALSSAYYAMLYAARAALSEADRYAKTHGGTWDLFHETFVATGQFDAALAAEARRAQRRREAVDYDAERVDADRAGEIVVLAERFLEAIATMLSGPDG
jgi:uncharacterized protein (UPF0332 family)